MRAVCKEDARDSRPYGGQLGLPNKSVYSRVPLPDAENVTFTLHCTLDVGRKE